MSIYKILIFCCTLSLIAIHSMALIIFKQSYSCQMIFIPLFEYIACFLTFVLYLRYVGNCSPIIGNCLMSVRYLNVLYWIWA